MAPETPKGVSSRLLTMKFMQRAAASSAASSPGTDSEAHSAKKRKLGHQAAAQNRFDAEIDQASIQAAIDEREAKRQTAFEKHATGADTHWVLPTNVNKSKASQAKSNPRRIIYVGYSDAISSDDERGDDPRSGRTSTKKEIPPESKDTLKRKRSDSDESGEDDSGDESSADDQDNDTDTKAQNGQDSSPAPRGKRSRSASSLNSRRVSESSIAKEFRDKRKSKEVKLSQLTSISSSGNIPSPGSNTIKCFTCNKTGHKSADCPKRNPVKKRSSRG